MNVDEISRLIGLMDDSSLAELQWTHEGERLLLKKQGPAPAMVVAAPMPVGAAPTPPQVQASAPPPVVPVPAAPSVETDLVEVRSPMVGTFYRSASPDTAPYVEEGGRVEKGRTICIVEAMKLMNEIESEVTGTVVKICVQNESPVEFGTVLFLVRTT
ncbi:MAG TPA: acetyl-CoA carboxylase biotin carboxyl carrier protein [Fibrobacteria bacterium]|nr:acetyl-CoA carboxylase biotin carboxyl carrier protein [Fibrobacteria bacterium]